MAPNTDPGSSPFLADHPPTIVPLSIKPHFESLTTKQKRYAHHLSRACFHGTRVTARQISPESEYIYDIIIALHKACSGDYSKLSSATGVSSENIELWLEYAAQFLGNNGNYKGFGDVKFVPRIAVEQLEKLCGVNGDCKTLFDKAMKAGGGIFETADSRLMHLGYPQDGHMTTYYPDHGGMGTSITKEEIGLIGDICEEHKLLLENTRLRKLKSGDFELLIASAEHHPKPKDRDLGEVSELPLKDKLSGKSLFLRFGDYSHEMSAIAHELSQALEYAGNQTEKSMLEEYIKSFKAGSIEAFKESQRYWIKDISPPVETDLGFVETYRDPHGVRGEWEGFVSMINQERTRAFGKLVKAAPKFIPKLPWPSAFEKDKFNPPDFTSLEVLTFAGSGIPAGINIPNYDDIRQTLGFKNVSLGNVLSAKAPNEPIPFIRAEDLELYRKYRDPAFEVQVGIHELLGHGTGKLLQETKPGDYNFDVDHPPISPITNKPITTWYKPGQTWSSVFKAIASSYEECRAECVAMVLSCDFEILQIFGFGDGREDLSGEGGDVLYVSYLSMARAGVAALEYWDPRSHKWGQAHMQARFSILRAFLDAGHDFVVLKQTKDKDGKADLEIHLDRSKILSHGRPAVEAYLQKLHVYKSTADVAGGSKLYDDVTSVDAFFATTVRDVVLRKRLPRKVFVQANTFVKDDQVGLVEYDSDVKGMVRSWVERNV